MPRRFYRRPRLSRLSKKVFAWEPGAFILNLGTGISSIGAVLFDPNFRFAAADLANTRVKVRRVIGTAMTSMTKQTAALTQVSWALGAVLHIEDREDTDDNIWTTTTPNVLVSQRVLHMDMHAQAIVETVGTVQEGTTLARFELDWKGQAWLRRDDLLTWRFQNAASIATVATDVTVYCYTRVLYEVP